MGKPVDSQCQAFQSAIDVLGRPWSALILNVLLPGPLRLSELAERCQGPGDKVLSARLMDLAERGLVDRQVETAPHIRVFYELTKQSQAFGQVAEAIERWGRVLTRPDRGRRQASVE